MIYRSIPPDSNGTSLERNNFDYLPDTLAQVWRGDFLLRRETIVPPPTKAVIELLNSCNLVCPMCRVGEYGINYSRCLPIQDFKAILSQISSLRTVRLNGLGESTLLPNFSKYLAILADRGIHTELITNGSGRLPDYQLVLDLGGHIVISWDAADPSTFERLRRPAKWKDYLSRIRAICDFAMDTETYGRCSIIFTLQPANVGQLRRVVELCHNWSVLSVIVNIEKMRNSGWITESIAAVRADFLAASQLARHYNIQLYFPRQLSCHPIHDSAGFMTCGEECRMPWDEVVIRWNGNIQPCNMFNPYTYGNIFLKSFTYIWNNAFAALFRRHINSLNRHPYCIDCTYVREAYE